MEKLIRDGKVAVLYSPGYGAGWSSWARDEYSDQVLYDREIAEAILEGDAEGAKEIAKRKCPGLYLGGMRDLKVEWVTQGTRFRIDEYDGFESLTFPGDIEFDQTA